MYIHLYNQINDLDITNKKKEKDNIKLKDRKEKWNYHRIGVYVFRTRFVEMYNGVV